MEEATALEDLTLDCIHDLSWAGRSVSSSSSGPAFMQLGLTKLQLCDMPEYGEEELFKVKDCMLWHNLNLHHLSSLTRLQNLRLSVRGATDAILDVLPPSLTKLHLEGFWGDLHAPNHEVEIQQETCRSFSCLTNLQHLDTSKVETYIDTSMLKDMTGLTYLNAATVNILWDLDAPGATFTCWSAMTSVRHLDLREALRPRYTDFEGAWEPGLLSLADCAALTASSQLTHLDLGAWQLSKEQCSAVLRPGLVLPDLRGLVLGPCFFDSDTAAAHIAACCPGITLLGIAAIDEITREAEDASWDDLICSVEPPALAGLHKLSSLRYLLLDGLNVKRDVWQVLVQLKQLEILEVGIADSTAFAAAMQLTTCRALRQFRLLLVKVEDKSGFVYCTESVRLYNRDLFETFEDDEGSGLIGASSAGTESDQRPKEGDARQHTELSSSLCKPAFVWLALPAALTRGLLKLHADCMKNYASFSRDQLDKSVAKSDLERAQQLADEWPALIAAAEAFKSAVGLEFSMQEVEIAEADSPATVAEAVGVELDAAGSVGLLRKFMAEQLKELDMLFDKGLAVMPTMA